MTCICENFDKISHRGPEAFKIEFDNRVKVRNFETLASLIARILSVNVSLFFFAEWISGIPQTGHRRWPLRNAADADMQISASVSPVQRRNI